MARRPVTPDVAVLAGHPDGPVHFGGRVLDVRQLYRPGHPTETLTPEQERAVAEMNRGIGAADLPLEAVPCLCGGRSFALVAEFDRYGIRQRTAMCESCGLVQSNPRFTDDAYHDFYASDTYRRLYDSGDTAELGARLHAEERGGGIFERVTAFRPVSEIGSVLEFGAGGGWNLAWFAKAGVRARGVDYSRELVELGRRRGLDMVQGSLDVIDGSYDVIVANQVIEHMTDPIGTLRRLRELLTDDGVLFVAVPDIGAFGPALLQSAHVYYFGRRTFEWVMSAAGFRARHYERGNPDEVQAGVFVKSGAPPTPADVLADHPREVRSMFRRYQLTHRLMPLLRAGGRAYGTLRARGFSRDPGAEASDSAGWRPLE